MSPILLPLLIFCGIASCVEAFPFYPHVIPLRTSIYRGRGIPLQLSGNDENFWSNFWSIATGSSSTLSAAVAAYPKLEEILRALFFDLPNAQGKFPAVRNYVSRPSLENDILQVYNTSFSMKTVGSYTVIVGAKGAGKSYATAHVLGEKPGVLYLKVTQAETTSTFGSKLLAAGGQSQTGQMDLGVGVLYPFLDQIAQAGHPITIVFEVERGAGASSEELLYTVKSTAKELAHVANMIIVLSEANAGLAFGDDRRQEFIWVDGMTHEEATAFAKKVFPTVADHDLKAFFEKVDILLCGQYNLSIQSNQVTNYNILISSFCANC